MLLGNKRETSVCIFEKENRLGGKLYDHFFSEAPDISVGQFSVEKQSQKICVCFSGGNYVFLQCPHSLHHQKMTGQTRVMNDSLDCCFCFILTKDNGTRVRH